MGQLWEPRIKSAARASPDGGHTGETLVCWKARLKLALPRRK
jgi:hypothetical protein